MEAQSPHTDGPWLITLAASSGGIEAMTTILRGLRADLPAAVVVVQHRTASSRPNHLKSILQRAGRTGPTACKP